MRRRETGAAVGVSDLRTSRPPYLAPALRRQRGGVYEGAPTARAMHADALALLRRALSDPGAGFRDGQWDAIDALLGDRARLLVVQRTGWGKSMVYFVATRLLRQRGAGPTLLVSPLLALMRNQIEAAERIGVRAVTINSTNADAWAEVERALSDDAVDLLLISPERLANDVFRQRVLARLAGRVGLLVVDEAHCISDWGHDFRPDYRRIVRIIGALPPGTPVLATTATANDRVVGDVADQIEDLRVIRGPLGRPSLRLQATTLASPAERLAWLAATLPGLDGSGIVYVRTVRDAQQVAGWLQSRGVDAEAYFGGLATDEREALEQRLLGNDLKALVATSALGMGFDKPDLAFVVHYQRPGSVVAYYQQVGRAGRAISDALGVLLSGDEDDAITDHFITSAFPPVDHIDGVLGALAEAEAGLSLTEIEEQLNLSRGQIQKVLRVLDVQVPAPIARQDRQWAATGAPFTPDALRIEALTAIRRAEQDELRRYMASETCLMAFLRRALDDADVEPCGRCTVCVGHPLVPQAPPDDVVADALAFLRRTDVEVAPRARKPGGTIPPDLRPEQGRALGLLFDPGWGSLVRRARRDGGPFPDRLVAGAADLLDRWRPDVAWVTCVPSLRRPALVPDLARRLAERLGVPFVPAVQATRQHAPQADQHNTHHRLENLRGAFRADVPPEQRGRAVLLVDDVIDSRWTVAVVAALLRQRGAGAVYPFALASG